MTDEFKKARDEFSGDTTQTNQDWVDGVKHGADWAYEWCVRNQVGPAHKGVEMRNDETFEEWLDEHWSMNMQRKYWPCKEVGYAMARAAWAKAQDEVENLEQKLAIAVEALQHCSIRSNSNPLDTARQALLKIKGGDGD